MGVSMELESVTGTSMGALLGLLLACQYTGNELYQLFMELDWSVLFPHDVISTVSCLTNKFACNDGTIVKQLIHSLVYTKLGIENPSFEQLPINFQCVATDLVANEEVVSQQKNTPTLKVVECVFASMCLPLLFPPVKLQDKILVDGALKIISL